MSEFTDPGTPWAGKTVFCLASGDTLRRITAEQWRAIVDMQARGDVVLAVNSSVKTARNAGCEPDAIFFTDTNWFESNRELLRTFPARVFTVSRIAKAEMPDKMERIENIHREHFEVGTPPMRDGRSSGHRAVSLAVMCGARRVVMLGYDMQVDPETGRSHCHDDYQHPEMNRTFADEFLPSFRGWYKDALAVGCEIINCSPCTILREFPICPLEEILVGAI